MWLYYCVNMNGNKYNKDVELILVGHAQWKPRYMLNKEIFDFSPVSFSKLQKWYNVDT